MIIDNLYVLLQNNNFEQVIDLEEINILGLLYYKSEERNVFIYSIKENDNLICDINNIAFKLKSVLKNKDINVWNSYMIICINIKEIDKDIMLIERDSKYLRKYVVIDDLDFERIYFLNKNDKSDSFKEKNKKESDINLSTDIEYIISKMRDDQGNIRKIDTKEIDEIVNHIFKQVGVEYEN